MSTKRVMLMIWAVFSLLWGLFAAQMFHLQDIVAANQTLAIYENRYMKGERTLQMRETLQRARKRVVEANADMYLLLLVGAGIPGIMLALGTWLMAHDEKKQRKKSRKP